MKIIQSYLDIRKESTNFTIPGTQMTSIFAGTQPPKARPKFQSKQVPFGLQANIPFIYHGSYWYGIVPGSSIAPGIVQYFAPFLSVSLHRMAEAFNTDVESIQREVQGKPMGRKSWETVWRVYEVL